MRNTEKIYAILNKPYGVLSQFTAEQPGQKTLANIVMLPEDVYPVGRLDKDSEGLLFLTNDKRLNDRLLNPANGHPRTYWVQVEGAPSEQVLDQLRNGIKIKTKSGKYTTKLARVRVLHRVDVPDRNPPIRYRKFIPETWLEIILTEGKNRQVRKMTAAVGYPTLRLIRVAIGGMQLDSLKPGELRMLDPEWVKLLLSVK